MITAASILLLLWPLTCATVPPSYSCQLFYGQCTLTSITVTKEHPEFTINFNSPHPVDAVKIVDSTIPLLTNNVCDTFPEIVNLGLHDAGLAVITKDALKRCTSLKGLTILNNPIQTLDQSVFNGLSDLRFVTIANSLIKQLPLGVFDNLRELRFLGLGNNHLSYDNPEVFKNLDKLEVLELYSNELLDLDVLKFVTYLPRLKKIHLNDNDFLCDRLVQIIEEFKNKGITVESELQTPRPRTVTVGDEDGNICIASRDNYLKIIETKTKKGEIPSASSHHQLP